MNESALRSAAADLDREAARLRLAADGIASTTAAFAGHSKVLTQVAARNVGAVRNRLNALLG